MQKTFLFPHNPRYFCLFFIVLLLYGLPTAQIAHAADATLQNADTLYHDISYEEELAEAVSVLNLGDLSQVTSNLVLPHSYGIHVNISWKSSNEKVIDTNGKVITPVDEDKDIILTAELSSTKINQTEKKEFEVHVPKASAEDILEQDAKTAQEYIDYMINNGYVLPDSKELGIRSDISWKLTAGEAQLNGNKVEKTKSSAERQPVEFRADLTWEGARKSIEIKNITLLDEYAGYILSYFAGKKESKEMYLGYSYDGIHWMRLNSADAVLSPRKGVRQIRDPFIMRKKDGSFAVFATNGWSSPMITLWDSEYLETFENERLCKLSEPGGAASGYHTWAPECNYDPITDQYYIYWSDPSANGGVGQIYYNTTADFEAFSPAAVFFEREFYVIDASIKKYKGDYYMIYQDATGESDEGTGGRRVYMAKADSLKPGTFYPYCGVLSEGVAEGPFLLQNFKDQSWFAYYDYYAEHKFGYASIADITQDDWTYHGISKTMPWEEVRHGGAIPVTQKELDKILDAWAKDDPELIHLIEPNEVSAKTGSKPSSLKLPKTIKAQFSDGNLTDLPVTWNTNNISLEEEQSITIQGTLQQSNCHYTNTESLTPQITIKVRSSGFPTLIVSMAAAIIMVLLLLTVIFGHLFRKKRT